MKISLPNTLVEFLITEYHFRISPKDFRYFTIGFPYFVEGFQHFTKVSHISPEEFLGFLNFIEFLQFTIPQVRLPLARASVQPQGFHMVKGHYAV